MTDWNLKGDFLESCNCTGACPCAFLGAPTEGHCTALVGWHIDQGQYGTIKLNDLNVAVAVHSPGPMAEGNWKAVLYLDERADGQQQEALGTIFSGQAGGHPAVLGSLIGEVLGVEKKAIGFQAEKGQRRLTLGTDAEADVLAVSGADGGEITIRNHPFAVAPGEALVVASSRALRHQAHGINLDHSGHSAYYSPFSYAGP